MTPEQTFGQLLGLGKSWRVVESRFESESATFFLKVEETPELWPEESARAGTPVVCHDHVEPMQWRHLNGLVLSGYCNEQGWHDDHCSLSFFVVRHGLADAAATAAASDAPATAGRVEVTHNCE